MRYLFTLFIFLSFDSLAQNYYWTKIDGTGSYSSPRAACQASIPSWTVTQLDIYEYSATCALTDPADGISTSSGTIYRGGDTCPSGLTYDLVTGVCSNPETICQVRKESGASKYYKLQGTAGPGQFVTIATGQSAKYFKYMHSESSICFEGCSSTTSGTKCSIKRDGTFTCIGSASSLGTPCTGSQILPEIQGQTEQPDIPVPQTYSTNKPCTYVVSGNTSTCQSIKGEDADGQNCGTFNGKSICVSKDAYKYENKIDTTVVKTTSGSNTITTKTDKLTATKCTGPNPCVIQQTTTTTTTTTKTTGGALIDSNSTCTGPACSNTGNPDTNGDGFGDSTTDGTCQGDECGEGEGGAEFSHGDIEFGELEDMPTFAESLESFNDQLMSAPIVQALDNLSLSSGGGTCAAGTAQTFFGAINFNSFCDLAPQVLDPLRYLFLAIWAWAAIRLFFTA